LGGLLAAFADALVGQRLAEAGMLVGHLCLLLCLCARCLQAPRSSRLLTAASGGRPLG
jgi:hypothetical protein